MFNDGSWKEDVNRKLDRILNDIEFIKGRTSVYLGRNEVLTYLPDETPIFVNSDDFGCPVNFMNGGFYEEDYFKVFASFRSPSLPMLDVGANLGVYSIRMASCMRGGKIHAFEPIPRIRNLFSRSVFLNGYIGIVEIHPFAVSDAEGSAVLTVPGEHAGGASLEGGEGAGVSVEIKTLDSFFGDDFKCGLIKLDVEGHELHALHGMRKVLMRSSESVVMFEKLSANSGIEVGLFEFFEGIGWSVYGIVGRSLERLSLDRLKSSGGYFIAGLASRVERDGLNRDFVDVLPSDLNVLSGGVFDGVYSASVAGKEGEVVFHGPYWGLSKGYYRVSFEGRFNEPCVIQVCEKFGFKLHEVELKDGRMEFDFPVNRELSKFEFVLRPSTSRETKITLSRIRVFKIG